MEGDLSLCVVKFQIVSFQSTPSAWRETDSGWVAVSNFSVFQSTPSAWRETQTAHVDHTVAVHISIHSLRMEGDPGGSTGQWLSREISIHSLRMEGDVTEGYFREIYHVFQSTPSAWRETILLCGIRRGALHFNPLPPHGGRLEGLTPERIEAAFQSTPSAWRETFSAFAMSSPPVFQSTPSAWRETLLPCIVQCIPSFQSTPSAWRETHFAPTSSPTPLHFNPLPPHGGRQKLSVRREMLEKISIHSLRMEGDFITCTHYTPIRYFNPLPPHGGRRLLMIGNRLSTGNFNPLPPHGGRHVAIQRIVRRNGISIHSLRMEGDFRLHTSLPSGILFQSTPSAWRETVIIVSTNDAVHISIHSLRMEGDRSISL